MTEAVQIALIAALPPTVVALGAVVISWRNGKKTDELKITVDGRLTQLLDAKDAKNAATAISAEAKGVLKEKNRADSAASPKGEN